MGWRVITISNPARLWVEEQQLVIAQREEVSFPLEDIAALVLESPVITLSAAVLSRLAGQGALVLSCDEQHLPCSAALPFAGHSRQLKMQRLQLEGSLPFRKRCWQAVIRQKIANQAECLRLLKCPGDDYLRELLPEVSSGDSANVEARAAKWYFRHLFGPAFIRGAETTRNTALNYGYAVVRAALARALAAHGLLLAHGIHHCSELNAFNLVDDLLEPLRPVVDMAVAGMPLGDTLEQADRKALVTVLGDDVNIEHKCQPVVYAAEIMAAGFVTTCRSKDPKRLSLPTLVPLTQHRYE